jgi:hypothetical protein
MVQMVVTTTFLISLVRPTCICNSTLPVRLYNTLVTASSQSNTCDRQQYSMVVMVYLMVGNPQPIMVNSNVPKGMTMMNHRQPHG